MNFEEYLIEICKFLPNNGEGLTETEKEIIKYRYSEGNSPEETADCIKYNLGGYTLEEYIADIEDLCDFCVNAVNPDLDDEYYYDKDGLPYNLKV